MWKEVFDIVEVIIVMQSSKCDPPWLVIVNKISASGVG